MTAVTAALVKDLREKTGAGMMDCKKALTQTGADIEAAVDWLRKNGLAAAAKKSGRVASEGIVGIALGDGIGAIVEVNAETDFVARNETFQNFVGKVAEITLRTGSDLDALKSAPFPGSDNTVEEQITHLISTIGENMNIRRAALLKVENGLVGSYMHNSMAPGLGKIGVLVAIDSTAEKSALETLGKQLAMHIAASAPLAVSREQLDPAVIEREKKVLSDQARESGKPEEIIEKMVEGRMGKFFKDVCLSDQTFIIDGESTVGKAVEDTAKKCGAPIKVSGFIRFSLGEGIEKKEEDFASEVAAAAGT